VLPKSRPSQKQIDIAQKAIGKVKKSAKKHSKKDEAKASVSFQFTVSLADLMARMGTCEPHFVRCVKPNLKQAPQDFGT